VEAQEAEVRRKALEQLMFEGLRCEGGLSNIGSAITKIGCKTVLIAYLYHQYLIASCISRVKRPIDLHVVEP
jgi:hypothetical protein